MKSLFKSYWGIPAVIGLLVLAYILIEFFPYPFFRYRLSNANISVYSNKPFPPEMSGILGTAKQRVEKSAFYNLHCPYRIFLCSSSRQFSFFTNFSYRAGGSNQILFNNNIFIRPANIPANHLIGYSGHEVNDGRTLAYYLAHEIGHTFQTKYLGYYKYWRLPVWKREGHADYVGKNEMFDYQACVQKYLKNDKQMDPKRSGLYLRYYLLAYYLIEKKGWSEAELLTRPVDRESLLESACLK